MIRAVFFLAALQVLSLTLVRAQEEDLQVSTCDQQAVDDWNFVHSEMDGGRAIDVDNSVIGPYVAKRFLLFDNWHPLLESKQISCGKLRHFKVYNFLFGEHDWNLYLQPTGSFERAFQDAITYAADRAQAWNCNIPNNPVSSDEAHPPNCFEAEVTPHEQLRAANPWFQSNDATVIPIDQRVCAMGPWVYEEVHGSRPELHPVEVIWWKDPSVSFWTFIEAQDSSHRFESRQDFVSTPNNWIPWAGSPRQHDLRVAAELSVSSTSATEYTVRQVPGCYANLAAAEGPTPAGTHTYTYQAKPILKIIEQRDDVGFTVKPNFCVQASDPQRLIGYIEIRAAIGNGNNEGYQAITVQQGSASGTQTSCTDNMASNLKPKLDSLRVQSEGTRDVLAIDATLEQPLGQKNLGKEQFLTVVQNGKETRRTLAPSLQTQNENGVQTAVSGIELTKGQSLALEGLPAAEDSLTIEPIITRNKPVKGDRQESNSATVGFVKAAGGTAVPPGVRGVKVTHLSLSSKARYVPTRNGRAEPEEESVVAEKLNQALHAGDMRMFAQMSKPPIGITWDYEGVDCGSSDDVDCAHGTPVPVERMKPATDQERAHPTQLYAYVSYPDDPAKTQVEVFFPAFDSKRVYQVAIKATATDNLSGNQETYKFEYWNAEQPIPGSGERAVRWTMRYAIGAAGLPRDLLDECKTGPTTDLLIDLKSGLHRRCAMLRLFAATVAQKGTMEIPDLRRMIKAVSDLQSPPLTAKRDAKRFK